VERADAVKKTLEEWNRERSTNITMPELALRFILGNEDVSTIIPGMRKLSHVAANIEASDTGPLPAELQEKMRGFRWVRKPASWSQ
jgi:aryl-alcohol dehydrogenase-like predicted oxidoreductase